MSVLLERRLFIKVGWETEHKSSSLQLHLDWVSINRKLICMFGAGNLCIGDDLISHLRTDLFILYHLSEMFDLSCITLLARLWNRTIRSQEEQGGMGIYPIVFYTILRRMFLECWRWYMAILLSTCFSQWWNMPNRYVHARHCSYIYSSIEIDH